MQQSLGFVKQKIFVLMQVIMQLNKGILKYQVFSLVLSIF